jgi:hypothetical protein
MVLSHGVLRGSVRAAYRSFGLLIAIFLCISVYLRCISYLHDDSKDLYL